MKLVVTSLLSCAAFLACLTLPACSGSSGGLGASDGGPSSSSSTSSGGSSSSGSGGSSSSSGGDGTTTCSASTQCGAGGRTYQECTTVDSASGACQSIAYKTSDGKQFTCHGCQSCSATATQLSDYCAGIPEDDGGTGTTTCSAAQACGTTGTTFQQCTTVSPAGTCSGIKYVVSNGLSYSCASCGDCTTAVTDLDSFCSGTAVPTTSCTSWAACGTSTLQYEECTTSLSGACQAMYYETSDTSMFQCNSCGDCTAAVSSMGSYCASMSGVTCGGTTCSTGFICCTCSGVQQCLNPSGGLTCTSFGCQ
jgi:hypothetical protein